MRFIFKKKYTNIKNISYKHLDQHFLSPSGWKISKLKNSPMNKNYKPLPWFSYSAIEFLNNLDIKSKTVFEYGSGNSTLWWSTKVKNVISIEHDELWYKNINKKLEKNVDLKLITQDKDIQNSNEELKKFLKIIGTDDWDYDNEKITRRGLNDINFLDYAKSIENYQNIDIVVVDGMARRLCVYFAVKNLGDQALIILDNSNRIDYQKAFEILKSNGYKHIPFWGLTPGADWPTTTSIFLKNIEILPDAHYVKNSYDIFDF
jgi:hypothetical protein